MTDTQKRGPRTKRGPGWRIDTDHLTGKSGCKHLHMTLHPRLLTPEGVRVVWVTALWTMRHEPWPWFAVEPDYIDARGIGMPCAELLAERLMPLVERYSVQRPEWATFDASRAASRAIVAHLDVLFARIRERQRRRARKEKLRAGRWSREERLWGVTLW